MKKISLFATLLMLTVFSVSAGAIETAPVLSHKFSVSATPPPAVLSSFIANFGNVPVIEWKLRSDSNWRAHFLKNGVLWEATFTPDGTLVKSEPSKKKGK
jgi:hypothetical protein